MAPNTLHKLVAILEKPTGLGYWLLDQTKSKALELDSLANLTDFLKTNVVVFSDAKQFFAQKNIKPQPSFRIVCLSTIKKLLAKNIHEGIKIPLFNNGDEAHPWMTDALHSIFHKLAAREQEGLANLECQVILATLAMESKGLPFNQARWQKALAMLHKETEETKIKLGQVLTKKDGFELFKQPIDLNNASDVKSALEQLLGKKLSGTSQSTLKEFNHEVVKLFLNYREDSHLLSTYGEMFLSKIKANRLYGTYIPIGSSSGRFACHDPNLLALPNHPRFQACIVPEPSKKLLYFDYGAFELRILAALSGDRELLRIFNDDLDIHSMVAKAVFNVEVSKNHNGHLRDQAKILNFGIIYGMGEHALAKQLKISLFAARSLLQNFFKQFSRVREFLHDLEQSARHKGYAKTALNRRVYVNTKDENNTGYEARLARNIPIQGSGADIVKVAMCNVYQKLHASNLDADLVNIVHDELVVECSEREIDQVISIVRSEMMEAFKNVLPGVMPLINVES